MTKDQNRHVHFVLCKCHSAFKSANMRAHLRAPRAILNKDSHGEARKVFYCHFHQKWQNEEESVPSFSKSHKPCAKFRFPKADLQLILEKKPPQNAEPLLSQLESEKGAAVKEKEEGAVAGEGAEREGERDG